jgi:hypothetical protein
MVNHVFAQSEVDQSAVSVQIQDDVFRLEISVDDVDAVKVLDGEQDLRQVEAGHALLHSVSLLEQVEEVSAGVILGDEEDLLLRLERADEFDLELNTILISKLSLQYLIITRMKGFAI